MTGQLSEIFNLDAYRVLFAYTRQKLMGKVGNPTTDPPYPHLVHEIYADDLTVENLFRQGKQKLDHIYRYDPRTNRTSLTAEFTATPMFILDGEKTIEGGYVMNSWGYWLRQNHPEVGPLFEHATQEQLWVAVERLGQTTTFEILMKLIQNIYSGLEVLHFCFDLSDEFYLFCIKEQSIMEEDSQDDRNIWLWYAHAIRAAMWALDIETPELDELISAVFDDRLPTSVSPFAQYLQTS